MRRADQIHLDEARWIVHSRHRSTDGRTSVAVAQIEGGGWAVILAEPGAMRVRAHDGWEAAQAAAERMLAWHTQRHGTTWVHITQPAAHRGR